MGPSSVPEAVVASSRHGPSVAQVAVCWRRLDQNSIDWQEWCCSSSTFLVEAVQRPLVDLHLASLALRAAASAFLISLAYLDCPDPGVASPGDSEVLPANHLGCIPKGPENLHDPKHRPHSLSNP